MDKRIIKQVAFRAIELVDAKAVEGVAIKYRQQKMIKLLKKL